MQGQDLIFRQSIFFRVRHDPLAKDAYEPMVGADPRHPIAGNQDGFDGHALHLGLGSGAQGFGYGVVGGESFRGADPQKAVLIRCKGLDSVARKTILGGKTRKGFVLALANPCPGADPKRAPCVLVQRVHRLMGQAVLCGKTRGRRSIVSKQSVAECSEPDLPLPVGQERVDGEVLSDGIEVLAVISTDAFVGCKPEIAVAVLNNGVDDVGGQPIFFDKAGEIVPVEATRTAAVGPDPEIPGLALQNRVGLRLRQPIVGRVRRKVVALPERRGGKEREEEQYSPDGSLVPIHHHSVRKAERFDGPRACYSSITMYRWSGVYL